jgi:hypothetical protein
MVFIRKFLLVTAFFILAACNAAPPVFPTDAGNINTAEIISSSRPSHSSILATNITYFLGSSQEICQLTGEIDRQVGTPTTNRTVIRFRSEMCSLYFSSKSNIQRRFI